MATGGVPADVDNRVTCSVCLEPYRGRQPKLLPCYHTFCSPCLVQMTSSGQQVSGDSTGKTSSTITCPTCRAAHPIPPGGVSAFWTDPYVGGGTPSGTTKQENAANPSPSQDRDDLGDDLQAKVKDQISIMEDVASRLTEEEKEIGHRMKAVELDIESRYETGLQLLTESRNACLVTLKETGQQLTNETQTELLLLQNMKTTLQQLMDKGSPSQQTPAWRQKVQDALLTDAAMGHFQQLLSAKPEAPALSYIWSDNASTVLDCLRLFMGTVGPSGGSGASPKSGDICGELVALRRDLTTMQEDNKRLKADLMSAGKIDFTSFSDQLQLDLGSLKEKVAADVGGLKKAMATFGDDLTNLQKDVVKVSGDVGILQQEMSTATGDVGKLQKELAPVTTDIGKLQQEMATVTTDVGKLHKEVTAATTHVGKLQQEMATVTTDVGKLHKEVTAATTHVGKLQQKMATVTTDVGKLQKEVTAATTHVGKLQQEMATTTTGVGKLQKDQAATAVDIRSRQKSVMSEISCLQKELAAVKDASHRQLTQAQSNTLVPPVKLQFRSLNSPVFFSAQLTENKDFFDGQRLVLDTVLTNEGGGYDPTSGIFTAPRHGLYLFMATIRADAVCDCSPEDCPVFTFRGKPRTVCHGTCKGKTYLTEYVSCRLTAGNQMWLEGHGCGPHFIANGYHDTTFCGVMRTS